MKVGRFVDGLKAAGVESFTGVSDSSLKSFCAHEVNNCVVKNFTPPLLLHQWGQTLCPHWVLTSRFAGCGADGQAILREDVELDPVTYVKSQKVADARGVPIEVVMSQMVQEAFSDPLASKKGD